MHTDNKKSDKQKIIKRLKIVEGQVRGLQNMIEKDIYCIDVITQTSAIKQGLSGVEDELLKGHLGHCVVNQIKRGETEKATKEILKVYHLYLNYENSCKMRYVPIGYGADLMHRLLEEDDRLLEAYANMNNSTIEATKIELELRKQEIINLFIFLCEVKKKILDHIKKEEYQLATEYIVNEAARLHL